MLWEKPSVTHFERFRQKHEKDKRGEHHAATHHKSHEEDLVYSEHGKK